MRRQLRSRVVPLAVHLFALLALMGDVAWASEGGSHEPSMDWRMALFKGINFAILMGGLYYLLNKPLRTFLQQRRDRIAEELEEARRERDEAQAKLQEIEASLAGSEEEAAELRRKAEEEAAAEREQILKAAEDDAQRIRETAREEIARATEIARQELRLHAAELATERAAVLLREQIDDDDRKRLLQSYLDKLQGGLPS